MSKENNKFIDDCISAGRYVESGLNLEQETILQIEDILERYNDKTARSKIKKILKLLTNTE